MAKSKAAETKIIVGFGNLDLATKREGDWVSLAEYDSLQVVYLSDVGTSGEDVTVKLRQAKTNAGGSAKDLSPGRDWYGEQNATAANVTGDTVASLGTDTFTDDGETACLARIEVFADDLDVNGDFEYVQIDVSDPGDTPGKLASALYVMQGARHQTAIEHQPTVTS